MGASQILGIATVVVGTMVTIAALALMFASGNAIYLCHMVMAIVSVSMAAPFAQGEVER